MNVNRGGEGRKQDCFAHHWKLSSSPGGAEEGRVLWGGPLHLWQLLRGIKTKTQNQKHLSHSCSHNSTEGLEARLSSSKPWCGWWEESSRLCHSHSSVPKTQMFWREPPIHLFDVLPTCLALFQVLKRKQSGVTTPVAPPQRCWWDGEQVHSGMNLIIILFHLCWFLRVWKRRSQLLRSASRALHDLVLDWQCSPVSTLPTPWSQTWVNTQPCL